MTWDLLAAAWLLFTSAVGTATTLEWIHARLSKWWRGQPAFHPGDVCPWVKCGSCNFRARARGPESLGQLRLVILAHSRQHPDHGSFIEYTPPWWRRKWRGKAR